MNNKKVCIYNDKIGFVEYVQHMGNDLTIVNSARVSFGKHKTEINERDKKLIKYLIANKHTSTLEHNVITFRFMVPMFVRSQHHRHRTWSYNEISRRYTDENLEFYEPDIFRTQHKSNRQASNELETIDPILFPDLDDTSCGITCSQFLKIHHKSCIDLYEKYMRLGVCREQARGILPQNLYTEYYGTVNLNNLIKFIKLREDSHAQWEIQKVALACKEIAAEVWPIVIGYLNE